MGRKSKRKKLKRAPQESYNQQVAPSKKATYSREKRGSGLFLIEVIRWCAYIALFAPLIVHPDFFFPFVVPKAVFFWIFTELMFFAWLLLALPNREFRPAWNPVSLALGFFLLTTIFTSFTGINVERSFWSTFERMAGTVNWIHLAAFFFVLISTFKTLSDWKKLMSVSFIAASIVASIFLLEQLGVSVLSFETRNGATIGNSSFMAAYLLFNVFFGLCLFIKAKGEWGKILHGIGIGMIVLSILTAYAYGAMVSMFGGFFIVILGWLFWGARFRYAKAAAFTLFLLGVFTAGIVGYGTLTQNSAIINKLPYFFSGEGTIGARRVVWEMAWQGIKERPLLGWGPENFNVVFTKYFNPCMVLSKCGGEIWFDRTHNTFLDHLINSGIWGLVGYIGMAAAALWVLFRKALRDKEWVLSSAIIAALLSYLVQNLLVFDMPSTYIMFAFALAVAAGVSNTQGEAKGDKGGQGEEVGQVAKQWEGVRMPSPIATVIVGLFAFYFLFSWGIQSLQAANWGIIINRGSMSPEKRLEIYKRKLSVSPLDNRQVPEFFTNNLIGALNSGASLPANFVVEVGEIMRKVASENPMDFREYLILGNYYTTSNEYDSEYIMKAEEALKKAIELSPRNQQGYTALGQLYLTKGENDKAIEFLRKAAELEPRYDRGWSNLADAYVRTSRYEEAKKVYERYFTEGKIPVDMPTITNIIRVYDETKDYEQAIIWMREVAESEAGKNNGDIHFKFADLLKKGGYKDEARAEALKAKALKASLGEVADEFIKELK